MTKLLLDNCCFCVELRLGSLIIGYLNLIGCFLWALMSFVVVVTGVAILSVIDDETDDDTASNMAWALAIISLVIVGILFTFAIVLLVGLHKDKPGHVKCYLIYSGVLLVLFFIVFIWGAAANPEPYDIISRVIGLVFSVYFILVIRSYYYQMLGRSSNSDRSPPYKVVQEFKSVI